MTIGLQRLALVGLCASSACVDTKLIGEGVDTGTSADSSEESSTSAGPTTTPTSAAVTTDASDPTVSPGSSEASSDDTTAGPVVGEWTGLYSTGFSNPYIVPCGEVESVFLVGDVPGYEICQADLDGVDMWIRIGGTRIGGEFGAEIHDAVVLEGPCLIGSCEPDAVLGECGEFDPLCVPPELQCDPVAQDCPDGSKCTLVPSEFVLDCVADGVAIEDEPCTRADGMDECAVGLLCVADEIGADGSGTCRPWCADEGPPCGDPEATCSNVTVGYGVCVPA